jgi:glycosyltransferase involved in cell wall biosynthesis
MHHSRRAEQPDIILSGFPSIELSFAAVRYGKKRGIPVILDVKDMWPDIFLDHSPAYLRPMVRMAFWPWFRMTRWTCAHATAITGMTDAFVDWAVARGARSKTSRDLSFPFGYSSIAPSEPALRAAEKFWDSHAVTPENAGRTVCFMGGIGHQLDLTTAVRAARRLRDMGRPIRFVMCGAGDLLDNYRAQTRDLDQILWTGWVGAAEMYVLMRRSMAGLDPLPDRYDFLASINNKAIEYFSAGLPVISSPPRGVLSDLLSSTRTGMSHECGDDERLAHILIELGDNPAKQVEMSNNGRVLFNSRFTAEKVYGEMRGYIEKIRAGEAAV